jgi:molecular chaperone DnaK
MAFIGIDLGTTTSEAAYYDGDSPIVLKDTRGNEIVDSYFGLEKKSKTPQVGESVKSTFHSDPDLAVEQIKRKMGEDTDVQVGDQKFSPEEVSAQILTHLKKSAEEQLDEEVDRCVITVPANFADPARRATRQAGEIAGMTVERIVNEPTAAALAYGHAEGIEEEHIMVYDLGGGTFDVSIVEYMDDVLDVAASSGDPHLGGKDFDEALRAHVAERFEDQTGVAVEEGTGNYYRLLHACEAAKKELSFNRKTTVNIPFFAVQDGTPVDLNVAVRRSTFEDMIRPMIDRTEEAIEKALSDAELARRDIDRIVLVGGSTRIPYVQMFVEEVMGRKPLKHIDPDKAVALGAAVQIGKNST